MEDEFSFLSDSDDERAVEDVLSQAMDHSVLEQLAAINCSSFSTSGNLPSHLDTRFRKLKSLPTATTAAAGSRFSPSKSESLKPRSYDDSNANESPREFCNSVYFNQIPNMKEKSSPSLDSPDEDCDGNRDMRKGTKSKSNRNSNSELGKQKSKTGKGLYKSRSDSWSLSSPESESGACRRRSADEDSDRTRDEKKSTKSKSSSNTNSNSDFHKQKDWKPKSISKSGTRSYKRSDSWTLSSSESETLSPPRRSISCLWCSAKKEKSVSRKHGKENRLSPSSSWGNEYDHDVDADADFLKTFSVKEQKKILKKAMKEEEKINREAEKIVKLAKQASSRMMEISGLHDELENTK